MVEIRLTQREAHTLVQLVSGVCACPVRHPEAFLSQVSIGSKSGQFPGRVRDALLDFRRRGSPTGSLLVTGLPVDDRKRPRPLPPTPASNASHVGARTQLARVQALLNLVLGEMVAYEAEGGGHLFQDMVPSAAWSGTQTSLGSDVELEIHTEQAFSDLRPDVLSLACLRGDADARTYTLPVGRLLAECTPEQAQALRRPAWTVGVDASFLLSPTPVAGDAVRGPVPILRGPPDDPRLVFDQDLMRGVTEEAEALRRHVVHVYRTRRSEHVLAPGEILFVDNLRAVHGRSPFAPRFQGDDRFVVRSFVVHDLAPGAHARRGRTVLAAFS